MKKRKHKHVGLMAHRLDARQENPCEVAFAKKWQDDNDLGNTLEYLLSKTPNERRETSERDRQVAATIIQWLGSTVGRCFLRDVIESCPEMRVWFQTT